MATDAARKPRPLPSSLAQIADAAGMPAAMAIAAAFGGQRVWLSDAPESKITRCVGQEAASKIIKALGHGPMDIAMGPNSWQARMTAAVARLMNEGLSTREIAVKLGCSERTVLRHKHRRDEMAAGRYAR